MRLRSCVSLLALPFVFAGCVAGDDIDTPDSPLVPDGTTGTMQVRLAGGVIDAHYIVHDGHMLWQGDIDLGPATESTVYGFAIKGMDHRWPDGIIELDIAASLPAIDRATLLAAAQRWSDLVPVQFTTSSVPPRPFLHVTSTTYGSYAGIGPDGVGCSEGANGVTTCDESHMSIEIGASMDEVMHVLGHVLGLEHETLRPDRDNHVIYQQGCVRSDAQDDFDIVTDSGYKTIGSYDIHSLMHYAATESCLPPFPGLPQHTAHGNCFCYPLLNRDTFDGSDPETGFFARSTMPDGEDQRVVTRMYEPALGVVEADDQFGAAMASGDFDGDGLKDLAVGSPGEDVFDLDTPWHLGEVMLYRGTGAGLVAWGVVNPTFNSPGVTQEFGAAIAAADLDGDGRDDLIIGYPGFENGTVDVILSGPGGPLDSRSRTLPIAAIHIGGSFEPEPARYGAALAVGDVTGDGVADLAVGAPNGKDGSIRAGWVQVLKYDAATQDMKAVLEIAPPAATAATNDRFGAALAIVDLNDATKGELLVGAPGLVTGSRSGNVFVYRNSGGSLVLDQTVSEGTTGADAPAGGDRFGAAIAWSKTPANWPDTLPAGKQPQIIIGAPGKDNPTDSGRVFKFMPSFGAFDAYTGLVRTQMFGQGPIPGAANQAGDAFGSEVALADFNGDGARELIVGVPKKDITSGFPDAGVIDLFTATGTGPYQGVQQMTATNNVPYETWGQDKFGSALATGDFDNDGVPDLAIGAPARLQNSGRIYIHHGPASGVVPAFDARFDQDTSTPE